MLELLKECMKTNDGTHLDVVLHRYNRRSKTFRVCDDEQTRTNFDKLMNELKGMLLKKDNARAPEAAKIHSTTEGYDSSNDNYVETFPCHYSSDEGSPETGFKVDDFRCRSIPRTFRPFMTDYGKPVNYGKPVIREIIDENPIEDVKTEETENIPTRRKSLPCLKKEDAVVEKETKRGTSFETSLAPPTSSDVPKLMPKDVSPANPDSFGAIQRDCKMKYYSSLLGKTNAIDAAAEPAQTSPEFKKCSNYRTGFYEDSRTDSDHALNSIKSASDECIYNSANQSYASVSYSKSKTYQSSELSNDEHDIELDFYYSRPKQKYRRISVTEPSSPITTQFVFDDAKFNDYSFVFGKDSQTTLLDREIETSKNLPSTSGLAVRSTLPLNIYVKAEKMVESEISDTESESSTMTDQLIPDRFSPIKKSKSSSVGLGVRKSRQLQTANSCESLGFFDDEVNKKSVPEAQRTKRYKTLKTLSSNLRKLSASSTSSYDSPMRKTQVRKSPKIKQKSQSENVTPLKAFQSERFSKRSSCEHEKRFPASIKKSNSCVHKMELSVQCSEDDYSDRKFRTIESLLKSQNRNHESKKPSTHKADRIIKEPKPIRKLSIDLSEKYGEPRPVKRVRAKSWNRELDKDEIGKSFDREGLQKKPFPSPTPSISQEAYFFLLRYLSEQKKLQSKELSNEFSTKSLPRNHRSRVQKPEERDVRTNSRSLERKSKHYEESKSDRTRVGSEGAERLLTKHLIDALKCEKDCLKILKSLAKERSRDENTWAKKPSISTLPKKKEALIPEPVVVRRTINLTNIKPPRKKPTKLSGEVKRSKTSESELEDTGSRLRIHSIDRNLDSSKTWKHDMQKRRNLSAERTVYNETERLYAQNKKITEKNDTQCLENADKLLNTEAVKCKSEDLKKKPKEGCVIRIDNGDLWIEICKALNQTDKKKDKSVYNRDF